MSDQYPFFAYLSRMRYINRWGLMRNTFQENIQEHSTCPLSRCSLSRASP